jgi:hypothetical protein
MSVVPYFLSPLLCPSGVLRHLRPAFVTGVEVFVGGGGLVQDQLGGDDEARRRLAAGDQMPQRPVVLPAGAWPVLMCGPLNHVIPVLHPVRRNGASVLRRRAVRVPTNGRPKQSFIV